MDIFYDREEYIIHFRGRFRFVALPNGSMAEALLCLSITTPHSMNQGKQIPLKLNYIFFSICLPTNSLI